MIHFILIVAVGSFLLTIYKPYHMTVYKDREHWEKSGAIVWEVNVREKLIALTFDDGPSPTFTDRSFRFIG